MLARVTIGAACAEALAFSQENEAAALAAQTLKDWNVPGLALAIVRDGRVVHVGGYGVRGNTGREAVTTKTLFGIGSITKSFTVLTLGTLALEGKLDWDKPVRDYMPDFRLQDPVAAERATARDLVTHRTGLPRHDAMWGGGNYSRMDIYERLRYLAPSRDFRAAFQYNNLMYMTGGILAERIGGGPWEALVKQRVMEKAGMRATVTTYAEAALASDRAIGHGDQATPEEIPISAVAAGIDAAAPAGAIHSHIEDMARYMVMHLGDGEIEGGRVLPAPLFREMRTPRIPCPGAAAQYPGEQSYGMGLFLTQYRGHSVAFHTGTYGGYHALLWMLPEQKFGVMILMNRVVRAAPAALALKLTDLFLGAPATDWTASLKKAASSDAEKTKQAAVELRQKRKDGTQPSHELAAYTGAFRNTAYGEVTVEQAGGKLTMSRNLRRAIKIEHWHYDVFAIPADGNVAPDLVRFEMNDEGEIDRLHWKLEPAVSPIVFERVR
ncbi:MAG: serine hydrolase [Bryobacteraceae bacterium]